MAKSEDLDIKVIYAGNCMLCGRQIKIVTKRGDNKFPNIFFCQKCERLEATKRRWQNEKTTGDINSEET